MLDLKLNPIPDTDTTRVKRVDSASDIEEENEYDSACVLENHFNVSFNSANFVPLESQSTENPPRKVTYRPATIRRSPVIEGPDNDSSTSHRDKVQLGSSLYQLSDNVNTVIATSSLSHFDLNDFLSDEDNTGH